MTVSTILISLALVFYSIGVWSGIKPDIHSLTGVLAILLMLIHAVWATGVVIRKSEKAIISFHNFSVFVWLIWLIPYFTGFFVSMF